MTITGTTTITGRSGDRVRLLDRVGPRLVEDAHRVVVPALGRARHRLGLAQEAVASAEEEQRLAGRSRLEVDHPSQDDDVVAAVEHRLDAAADRGQAVVDV